MIGWVAINVERGQGKRFAVVSIYMEKTFFPSK